MGATGHAAESAAMWKDSTEGKAMWEKFVQSGMFEMHGMIALYNYLETQEMEEILKNSHEQRGEIASWGLSAADLEAQGIHSASLGTVHTHTTNTLTADC